MERFKDHVVVITGAANGIGKACVERFGREGARVALLDIDAEGLRTTVAECMEEGFEVVDMVCDATDAEAVQDAVKTVHEKWGRLDVLVTSAGVYTAAPLPEVPLDQWKRTLEINLTGVFLVNQAVSSIMMEQGRGSIINIASMAGKTSWPATAEYSASKTGVIGLTRSVAMELAPYGVTVNAVCPGNTLTEMVRSVAGIVGEAEGMTGPEWLEMRANDCPMGRLGQPWEIAGVIAFLASEDSRYLTGQALEVDGGMVMS
jgi:NAD(P)-dependent dehydrogenase (short-subunit alcohol dehydrogenase family)